MTILRIVLACSFWGIAMSMFGSLVTKCYSRIDATCALAGNQSRNLRNQQKQDSDRYKCCGVQWTDAEKLRLNPTRQSGRAESTERDADRRSCRGLQKYHGKNLRCRRAQGHANADLADAARDRIGSYAVYADDSKQKSGERKTADENQAETSGFKGSREGLVQSTEFDGHFRIEAAPNGACSSKRGLRLCGGARKDGEAPRGVRALETADVNGGTRWNFESPVANVTHDADNRKEAQIAVHVPKFNVAAQGILVGPSFGSEGLADQSDVKSIGGIAVIEEAALKDGNAERLEVALGGDGIVSVAEAGFIAKESLEELCKFGKEGGIFVQVGSGAALHQALSLRRDVCLAHQDIGPIRQGIAGERNAVRAANFFDAGLRPETGDQFAQEYGAVILVGRGRKLKRHRESVIGSEARIDGEDAEEALAEETCADKKNQCSSKLANGNKFSSALLFARFGLAASLESELPISDGSSAKSGEDAERDGDEEDGGTGEEQDGLVDGNAFEARQARRSESKERIDAPMGEENTER